jgi:autotransporter translocation and assembly factor TamB
LKRALTILLVIAGVLVALVLLLVMTPVGWRIATGLLEGAVARQSGLNLTIGSLRGNLLSDVAITDARLSVPGGPTILEIDSIEGSYNLPALVRGRVVVPELRASNARVLFEVGPDGELTGWSRFVTPPADTTAPAKPWPVDVNLAFTEWTIVLRDTAAGYDVCLSALDVEATGGPDEFRASLQGSLSVAASSLSRPVRGSLSSEIVGEGRGIRIERLDLATVAGRLAVSGSISFEGSAPTLDLAVQSTVDLAAASLLAGRGADQAAPEVQGGLELTAAVHGPVDAIRYGATVVGTGVAVGGFGSPHVDLDLSGDLARVDVERFALDLLGGRVTGMATVGLAGLRDDPPRVPYDVSLKLVRLDLARLEPLLPGGGPGLRGLVSGRARFGAASADLRDLEGSFNLSVDGFAVRDTLLGELAVEGTIADGALEAAGRCCASVVTVEAPIEPDGVRAIAFTASVSDLSVPAGIFGVPDLAGSGSVEGSIGLGADGVSLSATVSLPVLTYKDFEIGPAHIEATGRDTTYAVRFLALGDVVEGGGLFDAAGRYHVSARVDSFDLASLLDEALRERLDFEGAVTASVSVTGRGQEPAAVEGTVIDLFVSARGERAYLETPFQFEAAPDTVHITWAAIEGTFGSVSVTGGMSVRHSGEILARLEDIDLKAVANVVPDGLPAPIRGIVDGDVRLFGRLDRPSFTANIALQSFAYGGLELRAAALEAMNDSTDILFDLRAESAVAGSVMAYGTIPIVPDSLRVMRPDPTREFGASVVFTDFTLDAGPSLLPGIRGTKRFGADGAVLLAGRADSLGSIYGRGSFGSVFATFDLIEFTLADTLEFEIGGGDIELARTVINIRPRRTLTREVGGAVVLGGVVRPDGSMDLSVSTEGLDVGQLVRAFGPEAGTSVTGRLDFAADVAGTIEDPAVDFTWRLRRPAFADYGFDGFSGRGTLAGGVVSIGEGVLSSGGRTIPGTGVIPVRADGERSRPAGQGEPAAPAREMDVRVSAGDFRLSGFSKLPPGVDALEGRLYCDLALRGPLAAPVLSGSAVLRDGSLRGFDLKEPVRNIGFELHAGDGAILLTNARAELGGGSVEASGAAEFRPGEVATFRLKADLRSPEIVVKDAFDARLRGKLTWAGSAAASGLSGAVTVEKLDVTYPVGLMDLLTRRPTAIVIRRADEPASRISLDVDVDVEDEVDVKNSLVKLALKGGVHVGGTALDPRVAGRLDADGGSFKYLDNEFTIETLEVVFMDPSRRDPYVHLVGTATVIDRSEEEYLITIAFDGFAFETLPQLSSEPPLNQGDILTLLTFGDTFGGLAAGPSPAGSSGDRFSQLARGAFVSSLFGVAESTLERILRLDTVSVDEEAIAANGLVGADVTIGKVFGDRLRVNYTTAVGEFGDQEVEVAFRLNKQFSIETRADPEGNHAIGLRLRIPFR